MSRVLLLFPTLAAVLLAAHFFRAGQLLIAGLAITAPLLLAIPRAWAARLMQLALLAGALEWLRTLAQFVSTRIALGQPTLRLAIILVAVAALTAASAAVFLQPALKQRYRL